VFKIFLANPRKPQGVLDVLLRERERICDFLRSFNWLKFTDQNQAEKDMLLQSLEQMHTAVAVEPS
jgi:hypothetical protein